MGGILDRDLSRAQTAVVRDIGRPVLQNVIDYGAAVFERCSSTAPDGDVNLGILLPLHHALEMLDGVEVLLDNSCVVAAQTPLRSAFEASLGLLYVLHADTEGRAMSYAAADLKERIAWYEEMDPDTPSGKRYREAIGDQPDFPFPEPADCRSHAASLKALLTREDFLSYSLEYDRVAESRRRPPWYTLFGGPANLRELAGQVGKMTDYLVLYRTASKTAHATDMYRQLAKGSDGDSAVRVIRNPIGMSNVYVLACTIGVESLQEVLEYYRAEEMPRSAQWFNDEINPALKRLNTVIEREVS